MGRRSRRANGGGGVACETTLVTLSAPTGAASPTSRLVSGLAVALLDRRERVEVALHRADELLAVVVRRDHAELLLAALTVARLARGGPEAALEARSLDRDHERGREDEQHEPRP